MKFKIALLISMFFFALNVKAQDPNNVDSTITKRIPGGVKVTFFINKKVFADNETKKDFGFVIAYYVQDPRTKERKLVNYENNKISVGVDRLFVTALIWENSPIEDVKLTLRSSQCGLSNNLTKLEANTIRVIDKI